MPATDVRQLEHEGFAGWTVVVAAAALAATTLAASLAPPGAWVCRLPAAVREQPPAAPALKDPGDPPPAAGSARCDSPDVTAVVLRGEVTSLRADTRATFHLRFADLPSRYSVMTGPRGTFEVRVAREELGAIDLCALPSSGHRPTRFVDGSMTIRYELSFER